MLAWRARAHARAHETDGRCPKCQGTRVGVVASVYDEWTVPLGAELPELGLPAGATARASSDLERTASVCTECGYYETYVSRPAEVAWEQLKGGFAWRNPGTGPFR